MCEANPLICLMGIFLVWTIANAVIYLGFLILVLRWWESGVDS